MNIQEIEFCDAAVLRVYMQAGGGARSRRLADGGFQMVVVWLPPPPTVKSGWNSTPGDPILCTDREGNPLVFATPEEFRAGQLRLITQAAALARAPDAPTH